MPMLMHDIMVCVTLAAATPAQPQSAAPSPVRSLARPFLHVPGSPHAFRLSSSATEEGGSLIEVSATEEGGSLIEVSATEEGGLLDGDSHPLILEVTVETAPWTTSSPAVAAP